MTGSINAPRKILWKWQFHSKVIPTEMSFTRMNHYCMAVWSRASKRLLHNVGRTELWYPNGEGQGPGPR